MPSGSLIDTYTIDNPYTNVTSQNKWVSVGVGIYNLNTATLSSGVQLVVDDDAGSYDVALYDSSNNRTSEIFTFNIDETCNRYEGKHIKFLNRLGGFDTFFFSSNENVFIDVNSREQYTKLAGTVSGSPVTWGYNLSDRGQTVIAVDSQERTILKSGALTDAEYEVLSTFSFSRTFDIISVEHLRNKEEITNLLGRQGYMVLKTIMKDDETIFVRKT